MKRRNDILCRITAILVLAVLLAGPLSPLDAAEGEAAPADAGGAPATGTAGGDGAVSDRRPVTGSELSMWKTLGLDILVPGGGHFYRGSWMWGITFAVLKAGGGYAIWYYHHEWDYNRSLYQAARKGNLVLDPNHELVFRLPDGSYRTVRQIHRDYDKSAQAFTITIAANLMVWAASLLINWQAVREANDSNSPLFDISFTGDPVSGEGRLKAGWSMNL